MEHDPFHDRLLAIVLRLPGAYEDRPWGSVHCKVAGKIFVGWHRRDDGEMQLGFRVDKELQSMLVVSDPRFSIAKYVGQHGGVDMRLGPRPDWAEVEGFIAESYRIIAPKRLVKELDARSGAAKAAVKKAVVKKAVVKKTVVKKAVVKKAVAKKAVAKKAVAKKAVAKKAVARKAAR